jgi:hypothetical protein
MDNFDLKPERRKINQKALVWNLLTVVALLSTCCLAAYFLMIYKNPNSVINLFPPQPADLLPTLFQTSTPTNTFIPLADTWTPTPTVSPEPSRTLAPTWTPLYSITPTATTSTTVTPAGTTTITQTPTITPNHAQTATAACITFHSKFPGTPCP